MGKSIVIFLVVISLLAAACGAATSSRDTFTASQSAAPAATQAFEESFGAMNRAESEFSKAGGPAGAAAGESFFPGAPAEPAAPAPEFPKPHPQVRIWRAILNPDPVNTTSLPTVHHAV